MNYLYHATFQRKLKKILATGLGNQKRRLWSDSELGVVYLAIDEYVAHSYCEVIADDLDIDDEIVVLVIDLDKIDLNKLYVDPNNQSNFDDEVSTYIYRGVISNEAIVDYIYLD